MADRFKAGKEFQQLGLGAGAVAFYRNGAQVAQRAGASLLDGRFSLYSNADAGPDLLLFNEGDNGGATSPGLTATTIKIGYYAAKPDPLYDPILKAAGAYDSPENSALTVPPPMRSSAFCSRTT